MAYRTAVEPKKKTTLALDPEVWRRFMEDVTRFEGPRAVSSEVDKMLRGQDLEVFAAALAEVAPRPAGGYPSLEDVERGRPRLRERVSDYIREERDDRDDRLLGLERLRKAVPRRRGH